jgi:hypothetical protein
MALSLVLLAGCATAPWPWTWHNDGAAKEAAKETKASSSAPPKSSGSQTDAQALQQVMSELQQVGALDPVAQDKLMADLKQVDPSLWPMVLQTFRAEAAYKRREEQREAERQKEEYAGEDATPRAAGAQETRFELRSSSRPTPTREMESPEARRERDSTPGFAVTEDTGKRSSTGLLAANVGSKNPRPPALKREVENREARGDKDPSLLTYATEGDGSNRLALSPELATPSGIDANVSMGTVGAGKQEEAKPAPEPPSTAERLAASRHDAASITDASNRVLAASASTSLADPNWQDHLTAAIHSIEHESKTGSKTESDIALQARLRMLYLLAGRRDDAMRPLPAASPAAQDYWSSQIYGLSTWMDAEKTPDGSRRAGETKRILSEALSQLGETAPLAVRNLTFCSEVFRFGSFTAMKSADFTPGQKVLLYAEIDNLHTESSAKGYHWAVKISGQIFDNKGNRMADCGSSTAEETYQTPRHDFFVSKLYYLPRLVPGSYALQLTIEDTLGHKVGQSSIDFTVRPQG